MTPMRDTTATAVVDTRGPAEDAGVSTWQVRLLPLMARMLIGLTVFFFLASFGQLFYLQRHDGGPRPRAITTCWGSCAACLTGSSRSK